MPHPGFPGEMYAYMARTFKDTDTHTAGDRDQLWVVFTLEEYTATRGDRLRTPSAMWLDPTDQGSKKTAISVKFKSRQGGIL